MASSQSSFDKVTPQGLLIAIGIVFGDIGTSPLYTISAVVRGHDRYPFLHYLDVDAPDDD